MLGLAAYVRAVALPLALLAFPYWVAAAPTRAGLKAAVARTALGCGVAAVVLLPWGIRNQLRYGEFFITDSHGGHTALVGANPDTEGVYSRSLNQMFWLGTGYRLFDPKPRDADRAAYALAKSWARYEPAYAIGLVAAKADRLLTNERPLLYWPLYRESVLGDPPRAFFDRYRAGIERLVDGFWYLLVGGGDRRAGGRGGAAPVARAGAAAVPARADRALRDVLLRGPLPPGDRDLHVPLRGGGAGVAGRPAAGPRAAARGDRRRARGGRAAARLAGAGRARAAGLRDRHRWAVCVCHAGEKTTLCNWRATERAAGAVSPVRGVWNGVGLRMPIGSPGAVAAATEIDLPPGRYRIRARADRLPPAAAHVQLDAGDKPVATGEWTAAEPADTVRDLEGVVDHAGGPLRLELRAEAAPAVENRASTVWLSDIRIEPDPR